MLVYSIFFFSHNVFKRLFPPVCRKSSLCGKRLNRVITQGKTAVFFSVSTGEPASMESEIARVFSLCTTEISEITRLKIRSLVSGFFNDTDEDAFENSTGKGHNGDNEHFHLIP